MTTQIPCTKEQKKKRRDYTLACCLVGFLMLTLLTSMVILATPAIVQGFFA